MEPVNRALVERIRSGDACAFESLFRDYYPELVRFARGQLDNREDAEDTVHDVFLRLWRDRAQVVVDGSLRAYLLAAVRNRVIDHHRHRATVRRWVEPLAAEEGSHEDLDLASRATAASRGDLDPAAVAELESAIRRAVAALPERCRTAFLLCRDQELSYAEAAVVMGVAAATVKTQMARALAALREALGPFLLLLAMMSSLG